jgi:SAM-dependent methyltransferase
MLIGIDRQRGRYARHVFIKGRKHASAMMDSRFWDDADVYDVATSAYTDDVDYWRGLIAERRPRTVLELACGTGRIALPLAAALHAAEPDFRFVGLDRSTEFLGRARARLADLPANIAGRVTFVQGDMRSFALGERFDLIILAYNSFSFLFEIDDQLQCLAAVRDHLAPGGVFAIDLHMPPMDLLVQARVDTFPALRQELHEMRPAPGIARVTSSFVTTRWDPASQTENTTHFIEVFHDDGRHDSHPYDITWHHVFPREMELLMRMSGLSPIERWGAYDRTAFSDSAGQYLWVMQAV